MEPITPRKKKRAFRFFTFFWKRFQSLSGTVKLFCFILALLLVCSLVYVLHRPIYTLYSQVQAQKELQALYFPLKEIKDIYIWHGSMGIRSPEYKVDLENGLLLEYYSSPFDSGGYQPRFAGAENEGFTSVSSLSPDKIKTFQENCAYHGLGRWKKEYIEPRIMDGHHWGVTVRFADGTERYTYGSNAYPPGWDYLRDDFEALTGKDLLE